MKYTYPNPTPFRAFSSTSGMWPIVFLPIIVVLLVAFVIIYPFPWVGFAAGVAVTFLVGTFVVSMAVWSTQTKILANDNDRFEWTYDLKKDRIVMSALDKIKISYEREGLRSLTVRRSVVMVQHTRGTFMLPLPVNRRQEILDKLRELDWISDRRRLNRRVRILALSFLVWLLVAAATAVIVYFLNYQ